MPVLDANALSTDREGLAFLRAALGEPDRAPSLEERFGTMRIPLASSTAGDEAPVLFPVAPAPECVEPRFAEALV